MRLVPSAVLFLAALLVATGAWASSAERVIYDFAGGTDGSLPIWNGNLIFDGKGNLYGTTVEGGNSDGGTVFELSPTKTGWAKTILYEFAGGGLDASQPDSGLVFDSAGNLYGTTLQGGVYTCGTVYQLTPSSTGEWTETTLFTFGQEGGCEPIAPVVLDKSGNIYGTTSGAGGGGTVFELTEAKGVWTETTLHTFGTGNDGKNPNALTIDSEGKLYGTTLYGGKYGIGTVFELAESGGQWTEEVIYNFGSSDPDGAYPYAGVTLENGVLYGTTNYGGTGTNCSSGSCGAVYKLRHLSSGWKVTLLHSFPGGKGGYYPVSGVSLAGGKLWGTATAGGAGTCSINGITGCGTIYSLAEQADKRWVATTYPLNGSNGAIPQANLLVSASGALYGTALYGGAGSCTGNLAGCGVIFKVIP
jgi:uncharacterized repeat protein (TIGR03803 family)